MKVLLASFEPRRDRTLAGRRFARKPTRHASSRQFESHPTKTRERYEHTLNAQPHRTIRQIGAPAFAAIVRPSGRRAVFHSIAGRWEREPCIWVPPQCEWANRGHKAGGSGGEQ